LYGAGNHLSGDKREENFRGRISVRPVMDQIFSRAWKTREFSSRNSQKSISSSSKDT
jgi:hypothetical protein